ncbi:hypothetical protein HW555_009769 [Spodoptera exigua]|uniref:Uncharacterized protein n=1 Tax=Spodoptera exigua TaxID=7107 RepID=A0A835GA03_SPOEX|nr:hypothetical protein HW555_009769 [Spodoptera exigua]
MGNVGTVSEETLDDPHSRRAEQSCAVKGGRQCHNSQRLRCRVKTTGFSTDFISNINLLNRKALSLK